MSRHSRRGLCGWWRMTLSTTGWLTRECCQARRCTIPLPIVEGAGTSVPTAAMRLRSESPALARSRTSIQPQSAIPLVVAHRGSRLMVSGLLVIGRSLPSFPIAVARVHAGTEPPATREPNTPTLFPIGQKTKRGEPPRPAGTPVGAPSTGSCQLGLPCRPRGSGLDLRKFVAPVPTLPSPWLC